jgi:hypothetical protein
MKSPKFVETFVALGLLALVAVIFVTVVEASTAGAWAVRWSRDSQDQEFFSAHVPRQEESKGYVSSGRCAACHSQEYESWHQSFHRSMTQWAQPETVRADFNNVTLSSNGKTYNLSRRGDEFWVDLENPDTDNPSSPQPRVSRRIGMLTGSHHMQLFWVPSIPGNLQVDLPFMYLLEDHRWVPELDTFLRDPKLTWHAAFWNQNCLQCHTTAADPGVRRAEPTDTALNGMTMDTHLGEMGIGCESCHGPGSEHADANANPLRRYLLHFGDEVDSTIVNPARLSPKATSEVCGQCHSIHGFDQHQFFTSGLDYRPGSAMSKTLPIIQPTRGSSDPTIAAIIAHQPEFLSNHFWPDGVVRVSGRDYNGLIDSPCYKRGNLSCLSCHAMHDYSSTTNQLRVGMEGNLACAQCHTQFASSETLVQHTHHPANSAGSSCYNCHMPYTTYGLLKAIRSHTIESPSVATSVTAGRPNGCNLCHLDQTLKWTDDHLVQWYKTQPTPLTEDQKTVSASVIWALRGDAGQRALIAWAMGWKPARQASGDQWLAPYLSQLLVDPYPAVRYIAGHSIQSVKGFEDFKYDFAASPSDQEHARAKAVEQWLQQSRPERWGPDILIRNDGQLQDDKFKALLQQRDDHSMNLQE